MATQGFAWTRRNGELRYTDDLTDGRMYDPLPLHIYNMHTHAQYADNIHPGISVTLEVAPTFPSYGRHLNDGCFQSRSCCCIAVNAANSSSTRFSSLFLLFHFIQNNNAVLKISIILLVARFKPFPI
jgi:hypothetical protein